ATCCLPVTGGSPKQYAAPRSPAVLGDFGEVGPLQVADCVSPKCVDLILGEHRRLTWRFLVALATQCYAKELDVLRTADGGEDVGPVGLLIVVSEQHAAETHAFNFKNPHTEVHTAPDAAVVRFPIAHHHPFDRDDLALFGFADNRVVEMGEVDRHRVGDFGLALH